MRCDSKKAGASDGMKLELGKLKCVPSRGSSADWLNLRKNAECSCRPPSRFLLQAIFSCIRLFGPCVHKQMDQANSRPMSTTEEVLGLSSKVFSLSQPLVQIVRSGAQARIGCSQGFTAQYAGGANPNLLVGAVVGGPDMQDRFPDERNDQEHWEPPPTSTRRALAGALAYPAHSYAQP